MDLWAAFIRNDAGSELAVTLFFVVFGLTKPGKILSLGKIQDEKILSPVRFSDVLLTGH